MTRIISQGVNVLTNNTSYTTERMRERDGTEAERGRKTEGEVDGELRK